MDLLKIVRKVFPKASNEEAKSLLENYTGYPCFWTTGNTERNILNSLRHYKRTINRGHNPCIFCNSKATRPARDPIECVKCNKVLRKAAQSKD